MLKPALLISFKMPELQLSLLLFPSFTLYNEEFTEEEEILNRTKSQTTFLI